MTHLKIDGRSLGPDKPTLVVAEIGVNHDGSVQRALELVRIAATCGAGAVKVQVFRATTLMHASAGFADYQRERVRADNPLDMLRRYELSTEEFRRVVQTIRDLKMIPLATPFSPTDVDILEGLHLPAVKIASPDIVNRPLLARVAATRKPMLLSTGAATIEEIDTTVHWLRDWGVEFALLHCISSYPTPADKANLCWIGELNRRYDVPVGYSDHTREVVSGALAVAAGAVLVERHLTYDRNARGPDHASSSDAQQFARYVRLMAEADSLRGAPGKHVIEIEQDVRRVSRQSLVLKRDLQAGDIVKPEDLTVQRPGTGLAAAMIDQAVGRRATRALKAGALLQWDMISHAA